MHNSCPKILTKVFLACLSLFLWSGSQVWAATDLSLTASPVRLGDDFSIKIAPGDKKQVQIKVRNSSSEAVTLESLASDFIVAADGATPVLLDAKDADARWSLLSWLTLAPASHVLQGGETATVNVLIEVPADALPGGRYAMIYHRPTGSVDAGEVSGSGVSQRVGTLLYVVIDGPVNEEAYINNFAWPKFVENGPVDFSFDVDNQSDIHIYTKPVLKVRNLFGREVANVELEGQNIFPKTSREFVGQWERVWGLGYYKAVIEASYGSQGAMMIAEAGLWMVPVRLILLGLVIILVLLITFIALRNKRRQSSSADSSSSSDLDKNHEESDQSQQT